MIIVNWFKHEMGVNKNIQQRVLNFCFENPHLRWKFQWLEMLHICIVRIFNSEIFSLDVCGIFKNANFDLRLMILFRNHLS